MPDYDKLLNSLEFTLDAIGALEEPFPWEQHENTEKETGEIPPKSIQQKKKAVKEKPQQPPARKQPPRGPQKKK